MGVLFGGVLTIRALQGLQFDRGFLETSEGHFAGGCFRTSEINDVPGTLPEAARLLP